MNRVNIKTLWLVHGMPCSGKSTFSLTSLNHFKGEMEGQDAFLYKPDPVAPVLLALDELLLLYWNKKTKRDNRGCFSVVDTMYYFTQKDHDKFKGYLFDQIHLFLDEFHQSELIIEGFLLDWYKDDIKREFTDRFVICDVLAYMYHYYVDGKKFMIPSAVNKKDIESGYVDEGNGTLERYSKSAYRFCIRPIKAFFNKKVIKQISPRTNYHYFADINAGNPSQQSLEKWKRFNIDEILKDKSFLDIGCNSGYNCIMAKQHHASRVIGIDNVLSPLQIASIYTNKIYHLQNVKYYHVSLWDYEPDEKYDVILCSSTFHYLVGRQKEFLDRYHTLLNEGGLLVLETGIADHNNSTGTFVRTRGDGALTQYPTKEYLVSTLAKDFELVYNGKSVDQGGDEIPREVFHFKKITKTPLP